jgi:lipoprotein-anchoring transpeptidase ErfK/SrfK
VKLPSPLLLLGLLSALPTPACKPADASSAVNPAGSAAAAAGSAPTGEGAPKVLVATARGEQTIPEGPIVGAIGGQVNILAEPGASARRIGYLRLGAIISRDPEPVGKSGCPGGWYKVRPRGYVCANDDVTLDRETPLLKAASIIRPQLADAMPYRYGFVRAVLPLYLKAPNQEEQLKSEFDLKKHLEKWQAQSEELNKVVLGSYDVPVDERGTPFVGKKVGDVAHPSTSWGQGELFGARSEEDAIPWWADGGRKVPNVADFKVPAYAVFADRARRHTGLSFVGSFQMGEEGFKRRFAITTDLRLAPTSKIKPDTGSPWHGIELIDGAKSPPLPFAWVRTSEAKAYRMVDGKPREKGTLEKRSIVLLTGKKVPGPDGFYWELKNGLFIRASQAGVVMAPAEVPDAAKKGLKWIDVSIENQTLVLWHGQKPIYATLVSTGQDGMGDPKKTKSTVRGIFAVNSKHITATMDSNEGSSAGGGKRMGGSSGGAPPAESADDDAPKKHKKADKGDKGDKGDKSDSKKSDRKAKSGGGDKADAAPAHRDRDPEYGVTRRRGEGAFWLRDVPYVQFFEGSYALHVAYWHDVFGIARSHGCINLSPIDGRYLFNWSDPQIPEGWHGALADTDNPGTIVIVHE